MSGFSVVVGQCAFSRLDAHRQVVARGRERAGVHDRREVVMGECCPVEVDRHGAARCEQRQQQPPADLRRTVSVGVVGEDHQPATGQVFEHGEHVLLAADGDDEVDGRRDGVLGPRSRQSFDLDDALGGSRPVLAFENPRRIVGIGHDLAEART
jgi:hypothetical protein